MGSPFQAKPKRESKDYSRSHLTKGAGYHDDFVNRPGRALMWKLERQALRGMLGRPRKARALDFACGTGRIAGFLKEAAPALQVHGVDISESMLEVARRTYHHVCFHQVDGREAKAAMGSGAFGLVTAFRFFANADDALRRSAADQICDLLEPGGHLIFNNHRNFWSVSYFLSRMAGGDGQGAENGILERLFTERGLEVEERYSLGVWPQSERRSYLLPWWFTERLERANLRWVGRGHSLGYNTIWRMRKPD